MLRLDRSVALALIFCSTTALAEDPESDAPARDSAVDEQPRRLRLRRLEPDRPKEDETSFQTEQKASQAANHGLLSPFTNAAVIPPSRAVAQTYVGYDSAISETRARAAVEGRI